MAWALLTGAGVRGDANKGIGVFGFSESAAGVVGNSRSASQPGVFGVGKRPVWPVGHCGTRRLR